MEQWNWGGEVGNIERVNGVHLMALKVVRQKAGLVDGQMLQEVQIRLTGIGKAS